MINYHLDNLRVNGFSENTPSSCDVLDKFIEGAALDLFPLEIGHRIHEVESDAALLQFSDEQVLLLRWRDIYSRSNNDNNNNNNNNNN